MDKGGDNDVIHPDIMFCVDGFEEVQCTYPLTCTCVYVYNLHNRATEGNLSLHYLRPNMCTYVTTLRGTTERYVINVVHIFWLWFLFRYPTD